MSTFVNEPLVIIIYLPSFKILVFGTFRPAWLNETQTQFYGCFGGFVVNLLKILNEITGDCLCWIGLRETGGGGAVGDLK